LLPTSPTTYEYLVDGGTVRIDVADVATGEARKLLARTNAGEVIVGTAPNRQRRPPEAVTRERPVDVVVEPVTKAPVADVFGCQSMVAFSDNNFSRN